MPATRPRPCASPVNVASLAEERQVLCVLIIPSDKQILEERFYWGSPQCFVPLGELDIKTLGCVRAEECEMETTVEFLFNTTVFVMTKHCCNTPFCNSAHKLESAALIYLLVAVLVTRHLAEAAAASQ